MCSLHYFYSERKHGSDFLGLSDDEDDENDENESVNQLLTKC